MKSKPESMPLDDFLMERLKNPKRAQIFLVLAYEEYLEDKDLHSFLDSLEFIATAKGGALQLNDTSEVAIEKLHYSI